MDKYMKAIFNIEIVKVNQHRNSESEKSKNIKLETINFKGSWTESTFRTWNRLIHSNIMNITHEVKNEDYNENNVRMFICADGNIVLYRMVDA